ncbi:MAG: hypothetical protein IKU83_06715 [Lachnospiraceae bacterium]|nr:hypothetical protein [Lachnospiraceae bacterium]
MRKERERDTEIRYEEVRCNRCGKSLALHRGILAEDMVHVDKTWGYGSKQDGVRIQFDLCEDCVQELISGFVLPPEVEEVTEWL